MVVTLGSFRRSCVELDVEWWWVGVTVVVGGVVVMVKGWWG